MSKESIRAGMARRPNMRHAYAYESSVASGAEIQVRESVSRLISVDGTVDEFAELVATGHLAVRYRKSDHKAVPRCTSVDPATLALLERFDRSMEDLGADAPAAPECVDRYLTMIRQKQR